MGELRETMKNTPGWVIAVCSTVGFIVVVAAFVYLSATKANTEDFRAFLNTCLNFGSLILAGGSFVAAGAAARNTNGALTDRVKEAVKAANEEQATEQQ